MLKRLIVIPLALALTAAHSRSRTDEVLDWNAIMTATVAAQNPAMRTEIRAPRRTPRGAARDDACVPETALG